MSQILENGWILYLLFINLVVFFMMYADKQKAKQKKWRIPEFNLLLLGLIGGGAGGLLGQQLFHHKTKKFRFYGFFLVGVIGAGVVSYLIFASK